MTDLFSNVRSERLYEKIVDQIRGLIDSGKLKPGDRLPGERELSEIVGCSRTSLREAFRVLESDGLIISKPGGGRFVQSVDRNIVMEYRFKPADMVEKSAMLYFLEAREVLEPRIVELAIQRAKPENITQIERILRNMEKSLKNPQGRVTGDTSFHLAIAEASQNFVFVSMMQSTLSMVRQVRRSTLTTNERYVAAMAEHQAIFKAIRDRDVELANRAILEHLQNLRRSILRGGRDSSEI